MIVENEPYLHWSIILAKMDLVSLYFRLLWYHSILISSIDQKHAKTHDKKFEDKTVKSTQLSLVLVGLIDFQIFPGRTAHAWSVEVGNICSVSVFFVRVVSLYVGRRKIQISPPLGEHVQSNALPQVQQRQSNPHPTPSLTSLPRRHNIDRCIEVQFL